MTNQLSGWGFWIPSKTASALGCFLTSSTRALQFDQGLSKCVSSSLVFRTTVAVAPVITALGVCKLFDLLPRYAIEIVRDAPSTRELTWRVVKLTLFSASFVIVGTQTLDSSMDYLSLQAADCVLPGALSDQVGGQIMVGTAWGFSSFVGEFFFS